MRRAKAKSQLLAILAQAAAVSTKFLIEGPQTLVLKTQTALQGVQLHVLRAVPYQVRRGQHA